MEFVKVLRAYFFQNKYFVIGNKPYNLTKVRKLVSACTKCTGVGGGSKNNGDYVIKFAKKPFQKITTAKTMKNWGSFWMKDYIKRPKLLA